MNCEELKEKLIFFSDSDVPVGLKKDIEKHLATCSSCKNEWENQGHVIRSLQSFYQKFDPVPGKKFQFSFPKEEKTSEWRNPFIGYFGFSLRSLAFAGAFLLLVVASLSWIIFRPNISQTSRGESWRLQTGHLMNFVLQKTLSPNDSLETGASFKAIDESLIRYSQRASVRIFPDSVITLRERGIEFQGKAAFEVNPSSQTFQVFTPCMEISVVGTEFVIAASPESTIVELVKGRLALKNSSGAILLEAGQTGIADKNLLITAVPTTKKLLRASSEEIDQIYTEKEKISKTMNKPSSLVSPSKSLVQPSPEQVLPPVVASSTPPDDALNGPPTGQNPSEVLGQ
ncbi:MAG: FecR family protein [Candidatus Ozemobacteraceae bacterium]